MVKLTCMMLVKNEANRYLKQVLTHISNYADEIVILDDNSTDKTYEVCRSFEKVVSLQKVKGTSFGENEAAPRYQLFLQTMKTNPEWIIALDADEQMENAFEPAIHNILERAGDKKWFSIEFYHFWNSMQYYRTDKLWKPAQGPRIFKVEDDIRYEWLDRKLHCGSIPRNLTKYPGTYSGYRVKHFGYADGPERTKKKYEWYIKRDPNSEMSPRSHYDSMLDEHPVLKEWVE